MPLPRRDCLQSINQPRVRSAVQGERGMRRTRGQGEQPHIQSDFRPIHNPAGRCSGLKSTHWPMTPMWTSAGAVPSSLLFLMHILCAKLAKPLASEMLGSHSCGHWPLHKPALCPFHRSPQKRVCLAQFTDCRNPPSPAPRFFPGVSHSRGSQAECAVPAVTSLCAPSAYRTKTGLPKRRARR